jgi:3-methyladenine DNA glycosylase AlkD
MWGKGYFSKMDKHTALKSLVSIFEQHSNKQEAPKMEAYMKGISPFLGIKKPIRAAISKALQKEIIQDSEIDPTILMKSLWQKPYREFHYFAMEYAEKKKIYKNRESIELIEWLITEKSWWDTVDFLASHLAAKYFKEFPDQKQTIINRWILSDNMWLNRSAIIFQIFYKKDTDLDILIKANLQHEDSKEFFIRKAMGWALRQYAHEDPRFVKNFVSTNEFSGLTVREALKHLS